MQPNLRSEIVGPTDVIQLETDSLLVWVRRPDINHANWWLAYYSTDEEEALVWDIAIDEVAKKLGLSPFHQGSWPVDHRERHPRCRNAPYDTYRCPGVVQAWEMWRGCSEAALIFRDATLEEILEQFGDPALQQVLDSVKPIRERAESLRY